MSDSEEREERKERKEAAPGGVGEEHQPARNKKNTAVAMNMDLLGETKGSMSVTKAGSTMLALREAILAQEGGERMIRAVDSQLQEMGASFGLVVKAYLNKRALLKVRTRMHTRAQQTILWC